MGTLTAQILVGSPHPNHGGITPTHYLFLSENSRPAWILTYENIFNAGRRNAGKITWIPTTENMLEDALLMIAVHVSKNHEIIKLAKGFNDEIDGDQIELYSALHDAQRKQLYLKCQSIPDFPKVVISVFRSSTIENQLRILKQYKMDVEVCRVVYSRLYSSWGNNIRVEGSLGKM